MMNFSVQEIWKERFWLLAALFAVMIMWLPKAVPVIIILLVLDGIFSGSLREGFRILPKNMPMVLISSFYILHVVAMAWSNNLSFGAMDLEIKLSLLFLPPVFLGNAAEASPDAVKRILLVFFLSAVVYAVYYFSRSLHLFRLELYARENRLILPEYPYTNYFFSARISGVHTTYMSMYTNLALLFMGGYLLNSWKGLSVYFRIFALIGVLVLVAYTGLLYSKSGFLILFSVPLFLGSWYLMKKKKVLVFITGLVLFSVLAAGIYKMIPNSADRVNSIRQSFNFSDPQAVQEESTRRRLYSWYSASEIIKENFLLGTGTGDIKDELLEFYRSHGFKENYEFKLNAHSQYFQSFAALGIMGILLLFMGYLFLLVKGFRTGNMLLCFFGLMFLLSSMFESVLEVQAGVTFFSFFASLLFISDPFSTDKA